MSVANENGEACVWGWGVGQDEQVDKTSQCSSGANRGDALASCAKRQRAAGR